jgi:hypothetical protein
MAFVNDGSYFWYDLAVHRLTLVLRHDVRKVWMLQLRIFVSTIISLSITICGNGSAAGLSSIFIELLYVLGERVVGSYCYFELEVHWYGTDIGRVCLHTENGNIGLGLVW